MLHFILTIPKTIKIIAKHLIKILSVYYYYNIVVLLLCIHNVNQNVLKLIKLLIKKVVKFNQHTLPIFNTFFFFCVLFFFTVRIHIVGIIFYDFLLLLTWWSLLFHQNHCEDYLNITLFFYFVILLP